MNLPQIHTSETERLIKKVSKKKIAKWLLEEGYYPEQYILPPCFKVQKFDLQNKPFFKIADNIADHLKFNPEICQLVNISYPKTELTDRTFGIIDPKIYHDMVWYLVKDWDIILKTLFNPQNKIYSYSFPLPITSKSEGDLGNLRAGRMIYEFLEMAEKDLVAEAYNYKFILKTDIKNFYPSIYTHSISWAIHTKELIRKGGNRNKFNEFVGLILDKLFQKSNDGCTNGIAIGPAISDLIAEIILSSVDIECSKLIDEKEIDFIGVRYKDDYRFLCKSKQDATIIIKILQKQMALFNLTLNENKTQISDLPEGLYREWTVDYQPFSLRYKKKISYKQFEYSFRGTLKVDKKYEGTGVTDRFLSELYSKKYNLKFKFQEKKLLKVISQLLMLKERRNKSLPQILGIIELMLNQIGKQSITFRKISSIINKLCTEKLKNIEENLYDLLWLIYFIKSNKLSEIVLPKRINSVLIKSLKINNVEFFKPIPDYINLFQTIKKSRNDGLLLKQLSVFKNEKE